MDYYMTLMRLILLLNLAITALAQFMPPFQFPGMQSSYSGGMSYPGGSMGMGSPVVISMGSKGKKKKHRHKRHSHSSSTSGSSSTESDSSECSHRRHSDRVVRMKSIRRKVLTPVVSYVTKEGYVVYQKKLKDKPDEWLDTVKKDFNDVSSNEIKMVMKRKHKS